jgi:hypothetical protein
MKTSTNCASVSVSRRQCEGWWRWFQELDGCFAVDMMQTEMELVQRISQNEDSIAAVNSRIEEFKVGFLSHCVEMMNRKS